MRFATATPYLACFVLLRRGDKVAFILRSGTSWMDGYYGLPAGKVEIGESVLTATAREAQEEVGVRIDPADLRHVMTIHRTADDDTLAWIDVLFETDIWTGEVVNAEPDKHSEVAWFTLDALPDNVIPVLRYGLEQIQAGQTYCQYGWQE